MILAVVGSNRVEGVKWTTVNQQPALRVRWEGTLAQVSVHREGNVATVTLAGANLGMLFSGSNYFEWRQDSDPTYVASPGMPSNMAVGIERRPKDVRLTFKVSSETPVDVVHDGRIMTVLLRAPKPASPTLLASAPQPAPAPPPAPALPANAATSALPLTASVATTETSRVTTPTLASRRPTAPAASTTNAVSPSQPPAPLTAAPAPSASSARAASAPATAPVPPPVTATAPIEPPPAAPAVEPLPTPPVADPEPAVATAAPVSAPETAAVDAPTTTATAELYKRLFAAGTNPAAAGGAAAPAPTMVADSTSDLAAPQSATDAEPPSVPADTDALYQKLFPTQASASADATQPAAPEAPEATPIPGSANRTGDEVEGLPVGPFRVRPSISVSYIDAEANLLATPQPIHDRYAQIQPRVAAEAPLREGKFALDYQPSVRSFGSFDELDGTTHLLNASLETPLGTRMFVSVADHFVRGVLEAEEVDPGREYFFDLGRFNKNALTASGRMELVPRVSLDLGGGVNRVRFDEPSGFFDYDSQMVSAGIGFEVTPNMRAAAAYSFDRVPESDHRPEAASRAHSGTFSLSGDLLPLVTGRVTVGYRDQTSPNAPEGGRRFRGLTTSGAVTKQFGRSSYLTTTINRSTALSAFERNAFYVTTSAQATLAVPLPYALSVDSGLGHYWNDYRTPAFEIGEPREDRLLAWFVGVRRQLGRRFFVSGFYRRERRQSNIDDFDNVTDGFILQLDASLFGNARR
jgi:hypothetical protein